MNATVIKIDLLKQLKSDYPGLNFIKNEQFFWSPKEQTVRYKTFKTGDQPAEWALLHEVSHGILKHTAYSSDFELIKLEVLAWAHAKILANKYKLEIDDEHIQDCLDTYRDWLHRRSTCPQCGLGAIQYDSAHYFCHSCHHTWKVSKERFCRPYRKITSPAIT